MAYRIIAFSLLAIIALVVVGFGCLMLFYVLNTSWVAPTVVSPSSDKALIFSAQVMGQQQAINTLMLEIDDANAEKQFLLKQQQSLMPIDTLLRKVTEEGLVNSARDAKALRLLAKQTKSNADALKPDSRILGKTHRQIERELAAGLITETAAQHQLLALHQIASTATGNEISAVLTAEKSADLNGKSRAELLARQLEISTKSHEIAMRLDALASRMKEQKISLAKMQSLMEKMTLSPLYRISVLGLKANYAFVPYENTRVAQVGSAVYSCLFQVIWCSHVGKVARVFQAEQIVRHPLFRTEQRGILLELELMQEAAATEKVLFIHKKPLGM